MKKLWYTLYGVIIGLVILTAFFVGFNLGYKFAYEQISAQPVATVAPAPTDVPTTTPLPNITDLRDGYIAEGPGMLVLWHFNGNDNSCVKVPITAGESISFPASWLQRDMFVEDEKKCDGTPYIFKDSATFFKWIENWQPAP